MTLGILFSKKPFSFRVAQPNWVLGMGPSVV